MIHESYRQQTACDNCDHLFEFWDHDFEMSNHCNVNFDRPVPCGSSSMGEPFWRLPHEQREAAKRAWHEWAQAHEVSLSGICNRYKEKP